MDKVDLPVEGELNHASNRRLDHLGFRSFYPEGDIVQQLTSREIPLRPVLALGSKLEEVMHQPWKARFVPSCRLAAAELSERRG